MTSSVASRWSGTHSATSHPLINFSTFTSPADPLEVKFQDRRAAEGSQFSLYAAAQFGIVREPYEGIYVKALQAQVVDCGAKDLGEYLSRLTEFEKRLPPVVTTAA